MLAYDANNLRKCNDEVCVLFVCYCVYHLSWAGQRCNRCRRSWYTAAQLGPEMCWSWTLCHRLSCCSRAWSDANVALSSNVPTTHRTKSALYGCRSVATPQRRRMPRYLKVRNKSRDHMVVISVIYYNTVLKIFIHICVHDFIIISLF